MGVEEYSGREMEYTGKFPARCVGDEMLTALWEVDLDEEECVQEPVVRLSALVRGCYLRYLGKVLAQNSEQCSEPEFVFTTHDIEKCTAQMELQALRACMLSSLYQKAMAQMTADVKRDTKELKLYKKLKELIQQKCTCSNKETKETQTDPITIKTEVVEQCVQSEIQEPCEELNSFTSSCLESATCEQPQPLPIPVYMSGMRSASHNFHYLESLEPIESNQNNLSENDNPSLWFGNIMSNTLYKHPKPLYSKQNGLYTTQKNEVYKQNTECSDVPAVARIRRPVEKVQVEEKSVSKLINGKIPDIDVRTLEIAKKTLSKNVDVITSDIPKKVQFQEIHKTHSEDTELSKRTRQENNVNVEKKRFKVSIKEELLSETEMESIVADDSATQDLLRMLESDGEEEEGAVMTSTARGSRIEPDVAEKSIWSIEKFIQQRNLHDKISNICCNPEEKLNMKSKFFNLFGYDSDEDEIWCSPQQIIKYRKRIAPWVVERLLPFYREKRVLSRKTFKSVAREITNKLISINHFPDEEDVEKSVTLFFSYHGVVASDSDIWEGWGTTLH